MLKKGVDHIGVSVVYFCHDGNGRFVMGKRSANARDEKGRWDIGGGGVELHDAVEETVRKEIKEEYGADAEAIEFLGFRDVHRTHEGQRTHWVALDFAVRIAPHIANGEPHKFDDVRWFTWDTMPAPTHSQFPEFLRKHGAKVGAPDGMAERVVA